MPAAAIRSLIDPAVVARLRRAQLEARLPMSGTMSGQHKSPLRGSSVEFAEYRKYVPGDDIRLLDWRVYARSDRFYMKEFEADTNLRACFAIDCSASMGFAGKGGPKLDYARQLIATLAYLVVQQGDAAGLTCLSEAPVPDIPPRRNPAHLRNVFNTLEKLEPSGKTELIPALHRLAERLPQRALVLIFSDCFTDLSELLRCLQHLRFRKHDLALFHLLDADELAFDFKHPTRFVDLESPATLLAEPEVIRARYLGALGEFLERLKTGCREFGVEYRRVTTSDDYEKVIARFLVERARRR